MIDLTTVEDVKSYLGLTNGNADAELGRIITAYSAFVRSFTNRDFSVQTYDIWRNGRCNSAMVLPQYPITGITLLEVDGRAIPAQTSFGSYGYRFTEKMLMLDGTSFGRGFNNVHIVFTAGLAAIPADLANATLETVGLKFQERAHLGYTQKGLAGETVSFYMRDMPSSVATLLNQYTNIVPS